MDRLMDKLFLGAICSTGKLLNATNNKDILKAYELILGVYRNENPSERDIL